MTDAERQLLARSLGEPVQALYRTCFLWQGQLDTDEGDFTLVFANGRVLRLTHTRCGYDLALTAQRWVDPFAQPLDAATQQWSDEHGRLVEVCLNEAPDWRPLVGKRLTAVGRLIYEPHRAPCGLVLHFEADRVVFAYDLADTVRVQQDVIPADMEEHPLGAPDAPSGSDPQAPP